MSGFSSVRVGASAPASATPVTPPANVKETPTGVQAEGAPPANADTQRPAWLPEKFKTPEEMAASYKELESKLGTPAKPETPPVVPTPAELASKGIDMAKLSKEWAENGGKLTDATRTELAGKGITPDAISSYEAGIKATGEKITTEFATLAGDAAKLSNVLQWAQANLSPEDAAAYDAVVDSGNIPAAKLAFQTIMSRYTAANGADPKLVNGERVATAPGVKPFGDLAEVRKAMSDPRYKESESYRQAVAARLDVSNVF